MHVPEKWRIQAPSDIADIINRYSFATVVSPSLDATHVPLIYDQAQNCLIGHIARNNPHKKVAENSDVLAIFHGPHDYIDPTWYQSKPAVPTWNYVAVHVHGSLHWLDEVQTIEAVQQLVQKYQPALLHEQELDEQALDEQALNTDSQLTMPLDYQHKLAKGIIGFCIDIDRVEAKAKLGQHRSQADQLGTVKGLMNSKSPDAQQLLAIMEQLSLGLGK
ncbi:FMN-binding negative transcriptional regulator [Thalassotalea euphylliae]|uniref:FMN-binding negative transcriptional regulator n=1 Tax=Thalassotalea euphylliae TaxID=1655234 RepID=A0A3E0TUU6_9GAMM|nr:FMN-binding negative transcriptional regulator [Thalassotalea euphylliae]REL28358.1 FMN-binding negative transcriptional regulator [Thalassotalea euphylliae]